MLKISNLTKKYKDRLILDNITYSFNETGIYFITGKSGSGKSTFINLLGRLEKPTSGEVICDKTITYVFQEYNLLSDLSVIDNIALTGAKEEDIKEILTLLDLNIIEKTSIKYLSGGEKQRLAIARALAMDTDIILLDEPTGNLDKENAKILFDCLKNISKMKLLIVVSHDLELANLYGDNILNINNGSIEKIKEIKEYQKSIVVLKDKKKTFDLKYQFKYSLSLIKARPIKFGLTILLSFFSILLLFICFNLTFYNKNNTLKNAINQTNREYYSVSKDYYNENNYTNYSYQKGKTFYNDINTLINSENIFSYVKVNIPDNTYHINFPFNLIIKNDNTSGLKITDFVAYYIFDRIDVENEELSLNINNNNYNFKITEVIETDYQNVYTKYMSDEEYRNKNIDDLKFYYGALYISQNDINEKMQENNFGLNLRGANFLLSKDNTLTYCSNYMKLTYGKDNSSTLIKNEIMISQKFYNSYFNNNTFPYKFDYKNIKESENYNSYLDIINLYEIYESVNIVGIAQNNDYDVLISEEFYNSLLNEYSKINIDGYCIKLLNVKKDISNLDKNNIIFSDNDLIACYTMDDFLNSLLKTALIIVSVIVLLLTLLSLYFSIIGFIDKKSKEIGVLKCLNISNFKILNIFIIYGFLVTISTFILSIIVGNIMLFIFNNYLSNEVLFINYKIFIQSFNIYIALFASIFMGLLIAILNPYYQIRKIDPAILVKINY